MDTVYIDVLTTLLNKNIRNVISSFQRSLEQASGNHNLLNLSLPLGVKGILYQFKFYLGIPSVVS